MQRLGAGPEAHASWCRGRDRLFRDHPQSALRPAARIAFTGLPVYAYDPAFAVTGEVDLHEREAVEVSHSGAGATTFEPVGTVRFQLGGVEHTLTLLWLDAYGGGLFLPFRDETNGDTTYGGGRYLLDGAKSADLGGNGTSLVLDFNFAYHPSCVHDARWSCPLAPPENRLGVPITAGERLP